MKWLPFICLGAVPREVNKKRDLSAQPAKLAHRAEGNSPARYPKYRKSYSPFSVQSQDKINIFRLPEVPCWLSSSGYSY